MIGNFFWTETCPLCLDEMTNNANWFCVNCEKVVTITSKGTGCVVCGRKTAGIKCMSCLLEKHSITTTGSVMLYNKHTQRLVLRLKHSSNAHLACKYAQWMVQQNPDLLENTDIIIPVPVSRIKLLLRKFNQSAMLAKHIARITNLEVDLFTLRCHITARKKQAKLNKAERQKFFTGVFYIHKNDTKHVADKRVLLIDDVITTGATANACASVLIANGAKEVSVLTLMRTPLA